MRDRYVSGLSTGGQRLAISEMTDEQLSIFEARLPTNGRAHGDSTPEAMRERISIERTIRSLGLR